MSKYVSKFVVINTIPTNTTSADALSIQVTNDYGNQGLELISVTPIPNSNPPAMLLAFKKTVP